MALRAWFWVEGATFSWSARWVQVGQKGFDFRAAHVLGLAFRVEEEITFNPGQVAFLGLN